MSALTKATAVLRYPASLRGSLAARLYATQTSLGASSPTPQPRRKAVTPFNDNGRVPWGDLSAGEKVARTTQQTFNFSAIVLGAILTVSVPSDGRQVLRPLLIRLRGAWDMYYMLKFSPPTVKRGISIELLIRSRRTRDAQHYLETAKKSAPLVSIHGANGGEIDQ